jgi:hypothetical protein
MAYIHSTEGDLGDGYGEPPLPPVPNVQLPEPQLRFRPNRPSLSPGQLRLHPQNVPFTPLQPGVRPLPRLTPPLTGPFPELVIDGFAPGVTVLNATQREKIRRFAEHLAARPPGGVTAIRFVSFRDTGERNVATGMQRAQAVQSELERQFCPLNPLVASSLRLFRNDCNVSAQGARVEVYTTAVRGASPVSPCVPMSEQSNPSLICPMPPLRRQGRSFNDRFWQWFNGNLDSVMGRLRVPDSWRGPIRNAARSAVEGGSEAILDAALSQTRLSGEAKEAIKASVRAAAQQPIP